VLIGAGPTELGGALFAPGQALTASRQLDPSGSDRSRLSVGRSIAGRLQRLRPPGELVEHRLGRLGQVWHLLPVTPGDVQIQQASLRLLVQLAENRQNRIDSAGGTLPAILWLAVIEGAIVVVGFTLFFGAPNIGAQLAMTGLLAATVRSS
jgi:hypothetical protein